MNTRQLKSSFHRDNPGGDRDRLTNRPSYALFLNSDGGMPSFVFMCLEK